jgi:hypothetical protein
MVAHAAEGNQILKLLLSVILVGAVVDM